MRTRTILSILAVALMTTPSALTAHEDATTNELNVVFQIVDPDRGYAIHCGGVIEFMPRTIKVIRVYINDDHSRGYTVPEDALTTDNNGMATKLLYTNKRMGMMFSGFGFSVFYNDELLFGDAFSFSDVLPLNPPSNEVGYVLIELRGDSATSSWLTQEEYEEYISPSATYKRMRQQLRRMPSSFEKILDTLDLDN